MRLASLVVPAALVVAAGLAIASPSDEEITTAIAACKKAYASKDASERTTAVQQLGAVRHKRVVDELAGPLGRDASPLVRAAAARALGGQWAPSAASVLLKALAPEDSPREVTAAVIAALGENGNEVAVPALTPLLTLQGKKPASADAPPSWSHPAIEALKKIGSPKAIDDLLALVTKGGGSSRKKGGGDPIAREAEAALTTITGQHVSGATEWRKWWGENKDSAKEIAVYRSEITGETLEKGPGSKVELPKGAYLLRTHLEGGGPATGSASGDKKPRKP